MPQLVKKRRSGWAVLAAGALVASLFAVGSAPAGAAEIKSGEDNKAEASAKPTFSACVGPAAEDAGFTDTDGLGAEAAINCLSYYGITAGKTESTFDPDSNVTRSQMALFLYRAASVAGVDLMGGGMDADYGDIADQSEDRQNAINALARNGILTGRSDMSFDPDSDITRAEMAVALVELTKHLAPGEFVQSGSKKGSLAIDEDDLDHYADARAGLPRAADTAVSYAYELAITTGYPDATFRPNDAVPRRNMASFIVRTLAHSNLRPADLTVQSDEGTLTASIRDADFKPVDNEIVDAFYVSDARAERAFNNDSECRSIVTVVDGSDECEIDTLDPATDADGNAQLASLTSAKVGKGVTVWVWTGDIGDEVDDDTDLVEFAQGPVVTPNPADSTSAVSPSQAGTPNARFGAAVEFTLQLQYTNTNEPTKATTVGTNPANGGAQYGLVKHVFSDRPASATAVNLDTDGNLQWGTRDANGVFSAVGASGPGGLVSRSSTETLKTGSTGSVTFSLTTTDPDTSADSEDDFRTVVYELTPDTDKNAPFAPTGGLVGFVVFGEAGSAVTVVKPTPIMGYAEAPAANRTTANGVVVSVLDQYHRPMRGQGITLTSSLNEDANSDGDFADTGDTHASVLPGVRHTASTGSVRISYSHRAVGPSVETITAWWKSKTTLASTTPGYTAAATTAPETCPATGQGSYRGADTTANDVTTADVTTFRCGKTVIYWVDRTEEAEGENAPIVAGSVDDNEIVVDSDGDADNDTVVPWLVRYDSNDILRINRDVDGSRVEDYVDLDAFEEALALILDDDNKDGATNNGNLTWDSYDHDDEDDRTLFTLTIDPA